MKDEARQNPIPQTTQSRVGNHSPSTITYEKAFAATHNCLWCSNPKGISHLVDLPAEIVVDIMRLASVGLELFGLELDKFEDASSLIDFCHPHWSEYVVWENAAMEQYAARLIFETIPYLQPGRLDLKQEATTEGQK